MQIIFTKHCLTYIYILQKKTFSLGIRILKICNFAKINC